MLLSSLYVKDFVEFELKHPITGAPLGAFVTVVSAKSDRYRRAQAEAISRHFKGGASASAIEAEKIEAAAAEALAGAIIGWRGIEFTPGEELAWSPEAALEITSDPKNVLIRDQIEAVIMGLANFVKA